ncbi:hypothetical protein BGZ65_005561 [Modicella reniformis]|uniref:Myb-like, SWIRM and MPN domain-containing protein 1 n=1 Tax=Modicella reniformis TaxID=1440133 RepID=A0A9P6MBA4_9FUNG|nr:hypothetical protein BGZ65_005561 [Modicella reniformis]
MADDEEDIDINVDIDGDGDRDEPEVQLQNTVSGSSRSKGQDLPTETHVDSMDDLSENVGSSTTDYDGSKRGVDNQVSSTGNMKPSNPSQHGYQGRTTSSIASATRTETYNGKPAVDKNDGNDSRKRKSSNERAGRTKRTASEDSRLNAKLSSSDLPSHNTRWTAEEDACLRQGIDIHGYGNWKAIAAVVGTRNSLQVKNHVRHLVVSEKIPHDVSAGTSDGEGLDRRSSTANSADEDAIERRAHHRRPRSKNVKRIDASMEPERGGYLPYSSFGRRARSITSESGNEEYTGSEFGATSGYDTDNDDDRTSKSPSLSVRGGSRSGSAGLTTPSPGLRPLYSASPHPYPLSVQRTGASSMDEDEDIDINIESTDDEPHKSKSRSISPFSNSSARSRLSSEFDSDSDGDLDNEGGDEIIRSRSTPKRSSASSPALSDTLGSSSDLYNTPNFNTSTSSINSTGVGGIYKPLLKDNQQQQQRSQQYRVGPLTHILTEKITNSTKERRTVSFGAVHVAELQPDINSYDEEDVNSSEDGGFDSTGGSTSEISVTSSLLSNPSCQLNASSKAFQSEPFTFVASHSPISNNNSSSSSNTIASTIETSSPLSSHIITSIDGYAHGLPQNQRTNDEDEEEGLLGTEMKRNPSHIGPSSLSLKEQQVNAEQRFLSLSVSTGLSISPQQPSAVTAQTQTSMASEGTAVTPLVTPPIMRRLLDKSIITEEEKQVHSEFFCNKASKTPERYQRIRNTILQAWEKSPSTYLTKTSVRSGLKDCGDVNAIGRVHSWLESIGAINVGMTASSPGASLARPRNGGSAASRRRGHSEERGWSSSSSSSAPRQVNKDISAELAGLGSVWVTPPLRRRRVRNEKGEWVDPKELEGRVIEHGVNSITDGKFERSSRRRHPSEDLFTLGNEVFFERYGMTKEEMEEELEQEQLAAQNAKYFAVTESDNKRVPKNKRGQQWIGRTYGSHEYEGDEESSGGYDPFRLVPLRKYNIHNTAPFRVKVSSDAMLIMDFHSHMAETEVIGLLGGLYDEDERILFILGVFPCRSISTGLQCEMDPESDVEARYFFSSKGFVVVGWYHSHPTFEPNPSIRDIENQSDHQAMFRRHNEHLGCRVPFRFNREITRTNELSVAVFQQLSELVRYYRMYEHRVDLSKLLRRGNPATRLDKLLRSISHHVFVDENTARAFLSKVRELLIRGFHLAVDHDQPVSSTMSVSSSSPSSAASSSLTSALKLPLPLAGSVPSNLGTVESSIEGLEASVVVDNTIQSTFGSGSATTATMDGIEEQQAVPEGTLNHQ